MTKHIVILSLVSLFSAGCRNSCQQLCVSLATYASETCSVTVPDAQIEACIENQSGDASIDDRGTCREYGSDQSLEEEWTCEELEDYFTSDSSEE